MKEIVMTLVDIVGWIGVVLIIGAYLLNSIGKADSTGFWYQASNVVGAVMIGINSYVQHAYPSVSVNVVWALIGLYAVFVSLRKSPLFTQKP